MRGNDTLAEIYRCVKSNPEVQITLVEGCCEACGCCDGFHPETSRCVHACGLIRDYKKDLDVFQGMMKMAFQYDKAGWLEPLDKYVNDPGLTDPDFDFEDSFPRTRAASS